MKMPYIINVLHSNYCKIIFAAAFFTSYLLIPKEVFANSHRLLALSFMLVFSLSVTCIVRNIKERIVVMKTTSSSVLTLVASIFGLAAFHVCGIGAPVCGASVGVGLLSIVFPGFIIGSLYDHANLFILASMFLQIIALYFMHCFHPHKTAPAA